MTERRIHKRYPVDAWDITGATLPSDDMAIIDIGMNGISLRANRRLNIGETYTLLMKSKGIVLNLRGTVMWSRISEIRKGPRGDTIPGYTAGIEFRDLSDSKKDEIINFIETHKKEDKIPDLSQMTGTRLSARVRVNNPEEALLIDRTETLKVKKMSYSGALLEGKSPIRVSSKLRMMINLAEDRFIIFRGKIMSCLLIRNAYPKAYSIGMQFTEMSKKDRVTLAEFIRLLDVIDQSPSE